MVVNIRLDLNDEQLKLISGKSRNATRKEVNQLVNELLLNELSRKHKPARHILPSSSDPEPELGDD